MMCQNCGFWLVECVWVLYVVCLPSLIPNFIASFTLKKNSSREKMAKTMSPKFTIFDYGCFFSLLRFSIETVSHNLLISQINYPLVAKYIDIRGIRKIKEVHQYILEANHLNCCLIYPNVVCHHYASTD